MQVRALRGEHTETLHVIHAVAARLDSSTALSQGGEVEPLLTTGPAASSPWRSAGKPWQLAASLEAMGDPEFTSEELAIGASSHSGEPAHLALVEGLLARFGVTPEHLLCGAEPPAHRPTWEALLRAGRAPRALHNDCSGKHTFMLGACQANGWPLGYLGAAHPLQQRITALVARECGIAPGLAVDGCGVPTFILPISAMARAWARLAAAMAGDGDARLGLVGRAMAAHPLLVSGQGRIDASLAARAREPYVGKIGAEGVFCVALPERRIGVALKVLSGDEHALAVAVPAVLERVAPGCLAPDPAWPWAEVRNVVGATVGRRVAEAIDGD